MSSRTFLFLQGVATPFFRELGKAIQRNGHRVFRVNFCGGDRFFSGNTTAWAFNAPLDTLPRWLAEKYAEYHFTDVVLFGDTRPVHVQAIALLRQLGARIHVYEEGYVRPDWITLERDGVNGHSHLLQQDTTFWQQTFEGQPEKQPTRIGNTFFVRAWHDICYRLANAALAPLHSQYQSHRPLKAYLEYWGWIRRIPVNKLWRGRKDNRNIQQLASAGKPYYVLPLQLDSDAQIRVHSDFASVQAVITMVMQSFARHAPVDSVLVIKNHPLDTGILKHSKFVRQLAHQLGIPERILFLETGDLPKLLKHSRGTVLVNSTTGTSALFHGSPLIALGTAIFNRPELTFQQGLDRFWAEGKPADKTAYSRFRRIVLEHTQINGDFYSRKGIRLAVAGSLQALQIQPVTMPLPSVPLQPTHPTITVLDSGLVAAPAVRLYGGKRPDSSYLYKQES